MVGDTASLSASELLDAWEAGCRRPPWARPATLLGTGGAGPEDGSEALPVGDRDRRLAALRRSVFGPSVQATAACPACSESAELSFTFDELLPPPAPAPGEGGQAAGTVRRAGYEVRFRLPTTADLAAVAAARPGDAGRAAEELLGRCVVGASGPSGTAVDVGALPGEVADAVSAAMAAADPAADVELKLACPGCGHRWTSPLDVGAFVWQEVDAWAERTLLEVDALARAYGWPEPAVLALSPWRRQRYLELAGA